MDNKEKRREDSNVETDSDALIKQESDQDELKRHKDSDVNETDTDVLVKRKKPENDEDEMERRKDSDVQGSDQLKKVETDSDVLVLKKKKLKKRKVETANPFLQKITWKEKKEIHQDESVSALNKKLKDIKKKYTCLYESADIDKKDQRSIFVKGFDCSFPIKEIKKSLIKHFTSCGEVGSVFIPYECKTGLPLGYAFINMNKDETKALTLDGSYLGDMRLEVTMAKQRKEFHGYSGRVGCERCGFNIHRRRIRFAYEASRPVSLGARFKKQE